MFYIKIQWAQSGTCTKLKFRNVWSIKYNEHIPELVQSWKRKYFEHCSLKLKGFWTHFFNSKDWIWIVKCQKKLWKLLEWKEKIIGGYFCSWHIVLHKIGVLGKNTFVVGISFYSLIKKKLPMVLKLLWKMFWLWIFKPEFLLWSDVF